jgi:hypothetical protein
MMNGELNHNSTYGNRVKPEASSPEIHSYLPSFPSLAVQFPLAPWVSQNDIIKCSL